MELNFWERNIMKGLPIEESGMCLVLRYFCKPQRALHIHTIQLPSILQISCSIMWYRYLQMTLHMINGQTFWIHQLQNPLWSCLCNQPTWYWHFKSLTTIFYMMSKHWFTYSLHLQGDLPILQTSHGDLETTLFVFYLEQRQ